MSEVTYVLKTPRQFPILPVRLWRAVRSAWVGPFSSKDPELSRLLGQGSRSAAGISVTPETAFTYSAVYDAVNQIASDVAKMPLNHMKRLPNGGSAPYYDSKLYRLLKYQPNPEMGTMVFRRQLTAWALVSHGGFAEIQRDGVGRPFALWPLEPHRVSVERPEIRGTNGQVTLGAIQYVVDNQRTIAAENMLHLMGLGYTPHCPYSLVDKARQAIGLALATERFGASFFGNGSTFGGMLLADNPPNSAEEAKILRETVESIHQGPDRAHKLAVLWGGLKYQALGVKPNEAQMNELRDKQVEEVARFFRMPPSRLGLTKPGTMSYNSVEMANLDYYTGCLLDWITLWEEELCRKLIPAAEMRLQFIKHNANVFLRGDFKTRMDGYSVALDKGLYSRNEVRELEDMGPQDGEGGDLYLVQAAQVPIDKLNELVDAQIKKDSTPPPAPQPPPSSGGSDDSDRALRERAETAEAIVTETRQRLEEQIAARAALEATNTATAAELEAARDQIQQTAGLLAQHVALAESLRVQASEAEAARLEAGMKAAAAEQRAADAQAASEEAMRQKLSADEAVAEATRKADAALEEAIRLEAVAAAATDDKADAERQAAEALTNAERADAERLRLHDEALKARDDSWSQLLAQEQANLAQLRAEADRLIAESERTTAESDQLLAEADAALQARETERQRRDEAARACEAAALEAQQAREAAEARAEAAAAELAQQQARDAELLAASRAIFVEAMGVLVRREVSQAKSKQATPEKLRAWLSGFSTLNQPVYVERLAPLLRLHMVLVCDDTTPEQAAETLAQAHIAEFERQLRAVLEAEPEEFHGALDRTLTRWEAERPAAVADRLLVEGIRHVR